MKKNSSNTPFSQATALRPQDTLVFKRPVLILDTDCAPNAGHLDLIAHGLLEENYEIWPIPPDCPCPNPFDPDAFAALTQLLERYALAYKTLLQNNTTLAPLSVHPGFSAWAERPELIAVAEDFKMQVLSPSARILDLFQSKLNLLFRLQQHQLPNTILSFDPLENAQELQAWLLQQPPSTSTRYPLLLRPYRYRSGLAEPLLVQTEKDLHRDLPIWLEQLHHSTGSSLFFVEKCWEDARQIEQPFARFQNGALTLLPPIETSLAWNRRPFITHAPTFLPDTLLEERLKPLVQAAAEATQFVGLGTFVFQIIDDKAYFSNGWAGLRPQDRVWADHGGTSPIAWQLSTQGIRQAFQYPPRAPKNGCSVQIQIWPFEPWTGIPTAQSAPTAASFHRPPWSWTQNLLPIGSILISGKNWSQALASAKPIVRALEEQSEWLPQSLFIQELLQNIFVREGFFHHTWIETDFVPRSTPSVPEYEKMVPIRKPHPSAKPLRALCNGLVSSLYFRQGAELSPQSCLLTLESMQTLIAHRVPESVTLIEVCITIGEPVAEGQLLAWLLPRRIHA